MGRLLLVGVSATPFYRIYDADTWLTPDDELTFHTLALPITATVNHQALNPAQTLLAFAVAQTTPRMYVVNTADGSEVTLTSGAPTAAVNGLAFSPDGSKLAMTSAAFPYLAVLDVATWTGLTITGGNPPGTAYQTTFSPDGSKLAVGHESSPFLTVYNVADWSKITITGGNPGSSGQGVAWSYDGALLAVSCFTSPYAVCYTVADWSKLAAPATLPAAGCYGVLFTDAWQTKAITTSIGHEVLDDAGSPAVRTVRAYERATGKLIAQKNSDASGDFAMRLLTSSEKQLVYLDDAAGGLYNDLIHRVLPG